MSKKWRNYFKYVFIVVFAFLVLSRYIDFPMGIVILFGTSMKPSMNPGDMAILVKGEYSEGDVVLWCTNMFNCVLHRVISLSDGNVVTKGDANSVPDPPIPRSLVKYKVLVNIPFYIWIPGVGLIIYLLYREK